MKLTIQAPGKLMISGEWAVLEGKECLVGAFDRYVYCEYEANEAMLLHLPDFKLRDLALRFENQKLSFANELDETQQEQTRVARYAIETALQYLSSMNQPIPGFSILIDAVEFSLATGNGQSSKVGLGASAAITVAILGAFLKTAGEDIQQKDTQLKIFKLAAISHYRAQGKSGSGFDIAATTFGGLLRYRRFDADWLKQGLATQSLPDLLKAEWPGLKIEQVTLPEQFQITAAFSGVSANTTEMMKLMQNFKQTDPESYKTLIDMIGETTQKMFDAIADNHNEYILNLIEANRVCLQKLGELSGVAIETEPLAKMADLAKKQQGGAKLSGAGGGDCAIAICFDSFDKEDIDWAWEEAGFIPLDVFISDKGVSVWL